MLALRVSVSDEQADRLSELLVRTIELDEVRRFLHLIPQGDVLKLLGYLEGGAFTVDVTFRREPVHASVN